MTNTDNARAAALKARQDKALDQLHNFADIGHATFRELIEGGAFAYRTVRHYSDGKRRYGFIMREDVNVATTDELAYVPYLDCPKVVFDYVPGLDSVEVAPDKAVVIN